MVVIGPAADPDTAERSGDSGHLDDASLDRLFEVLARYHRLRDRAAYTTFTLANGELDIAAFKGLFHLHRRPMRSSELADAMGADPSTVSRHVAQLVDLGLIRREADPNDGRATLLVITDEGKLRVESLREARRARMQEAMSDWSDSELTELVDLFERFVTAFDVVVDPDALRKSPLAGADISGAESPSPPESGTADVPSAAPGVHDPKGKP